MGAPAIELPCLTQVPHWKGQVEGLQAGLRCSSAASPCRDCLAYHSLCTKLASAGLCEVMPVKHCKSSTRKLGCSRPGFCRAGDRKRFR